MGKGKGTTWIARQKQNALHKGTQGINKDHPNEEELEGIKERKGKVPRRVVQTQNTVVGKETTKVVREVTMPMIERQKQNALHKGKSGISSANLALNRQRWVRKHLD